MLHKPFPVIPIVGPHNLDELESCAKACSIALGAAEILWLSGEDGAP